jgi:hypothetical protein
VFIGAGNEFVEVHIFGDDQNPDVITAKAEEEKVWILCVN